MLETQEILAVVSLQDATRDQQLAFMGKMLDLKWRLSNQIQGGFVATYPLEFCDDVLVNESEREIAECAAHTGVAEWDAVCVLQ
jgi:hypothetical protein